MGRLRRQMSYRDAWIAMVGDTRQFDTPLTALDTASVFFSRKHHVGLIYSVHLPHSGNEPPTPQYTPPRQLLHTTPSYPPHLLLHLPFDPTDSPHPSINQRRIHHGDTSTCIKHFKRLLAVRDAAGGEDDFLL